MSSVASQNVMPDKGMLSYLPVALFGSVMGLIGLSGAWRLAHAQFGAPLWIAHALAVLAVLAFIAQSTGYAVKAFTDFSAVRAEFNHPVAGNLFGTPLISLLLLPLLLVDVNLTLARVVWVIGAVLMTLFAWTIVSRWITTKQKIAHATPAWIVPAVGLIDIPLAVPALGWQTELHGVMAFAVAVGLFFAIPLFTLILARLMYEDPLPPAMQPSLLIMVAPFAVGFPAYVATTGNIDFFAEVLYMLTLFMVAVLLGRLRQLPRTCPFRVAWWSASFPLAASASTSLRYAAHAGDLTTHLIAGVMLAIATIVILALAWRTLSGIAKGELQALTG